MTRDCGRRQSWFMLLFVPLAAVCGAQQARNISIQDPRPLAAFADALEERFGVAVHYEDPEYVHSSDVADVTASVSRQGKTP